MPIGINITGKVGIEGEKSKLFYKCAEIMKEVNPTYFLYEVIDGKCVKTKYKADNPLELNKWIK